jgi:hypothetical protein
VMPVSPAKPAAPAMSFSAPITKPITPIQVQPAMSSSPVAASSAGSGAIMTNDVFKPAKNEPVFQPKSEITATPSKSTFSIPSLKQDISSINAPMTSQSSAGAVRMEDRPSKGSTWSVIVMGLITLVLVGISGFLYKNTSELDARVRELTADKASLNVQISSLQSTANGANERVAVLENDLKNVSDQLALFVLPKGTSTEPLLVTLKGAVGGGVDRAAYTLTTDKSIVVTLKNGKEPAVEAVIKPLLGTSIEVTGTYVPNSREVVVTAVNGTSLQ